MTVLQSVGTAPPNYRMKLSVRPVTSLAKGPPLTPGVLRTLGEGR